MFVKRDSKANSATPSISVIQILARVVQLVSSWVMISLCASVHHLSRELYAQMQNNVTSTPASMLVLVMKMGLVITALAGWDSLEIIAKVTCVIRILAFMEDTAEFFMVILNVIAPQFSKEIDARFLTLVPLIRA